MARFPRVDSQISACRRKMRRNRNKKKYSSSRGCEFVEKQVFPCMLGHFPSTGRMRKKCGNVEMQIAMEKVEILWSGKHTNVEKIVENPSACLGKVEIRSGLICGRNRRSWFKCRGIRWKNLLFSFPHRFPQCVENNVESRLKVVKNVQNRHYALLLSQIFLMVSSTSCFSV